MDTLTVVVSLASALVAALLGALLANLFAKQREGKRAERTAEVRPQAEPERALPEDASERRQVIDRLIKDFASQHDALRKGLVTLTRHFDDERVELVKWYSDLELWQAKLEGWEQLLERREAETKAAAAETKDRLEAAHRATDNAEKYLKGLREFAELTAAQSKSSDAAHSSFKAPEAPASRSGKASKPTTSTDGQSPGEAPPTHAAEARKPGKKADSNGATVAAVEIDLASPATSEKWTTR
jgi:hypothetical protein